MTSFTKTNQHDKDEKSLWVIDAPPPVSFESLAGNQTTDVAIVGAGIAGLSLAYHLTRLGVQPIVLEATIPGSNATGKSAGIITSFPVARTPNDLLKKCGEAEGSALISLFGNSGKYTFSLIGHLGLNCGQLPNGFLAPARPSKLIEKLSTAASEWQALGYDFQFIHENRTRVLTGLNIYRGSLLDPNGGALNPFAYTMELARVVRDAGAKIFTHSKVTNIYRNNADWHVECENGTVTARQVILCAGGGNRFLHPLLARSALPLHVYQMATEPLDAEIRSVILPEKHSMTDVHPHLFSMRYDTRNRLITACPAFLLANSVTRARNSVLKRLKKISPLFATVDIDHVWSGMAWINPSILPEFYSLSEGLYAVQACNGRGLAVNTILGKEIADYIISAGKTKASIKPGASRSIRAYPITSLIPQLLINFARLRSTVIEPVPNPGE